MTEADWSFAMLIRGSSEAKDEATVHRKNSQIGRSKGVRRRPVFLLESVRTSHPAATMANEISPAAIECGAKTEKRRRPTVAVCWPRRDQRSPFGAAGKLLGGFDPDFNRVIS